MSKQEKRTVWVAAVIRSPTSPLQSPHPNSQTPETAHSELYFRSKGVLGNLQVLLLS